MVLPNESEKSQSADLSPYELARLERIRRNEERLKSLGLLGNNGKSHLSLSAPKPTLRANKTSASAGIVDSRLPRRKRPRPSLVPTRSSRRLKESEERKIKEEEVHATNVRNKKEKRPNEATPYIESRESEQDNTLTSKIDLDEDETNYDRMPKEPEELDDDEFLVYVSLRAWRLQRKNELEVEPYKICQNRTLCELIRRRRNNKQFAFHNAQKLSEKKSDVLQIDDSVGEANGEAAIEVDLLSVWGIGPSKASKHGFGWEMLEVMNSSENFKLLECSRNKLNATN